MRRLFFSGIILILAAALSSCSRQKPAPAVVPPLRIATWNVFVLNQDMEGIERVIRHADADVICLQETNASHQVWLHEQLSDLYPFQSAFLGRVASGPTILSKFPLSQAKYRPSTWGLNGYSYAEIEYAGRSVQVVNLHLQPPWFNHGKSIKGLLSSFREQELVHAREIAELWDEMPRRDPAIVLGDLNCLADMQAYRYLTEHGFSDALAAIHGRPAAQPTIRHDWKGFDASLCIDFIFISPAFTPRDAGTRFGHPSDHNLVWAELDFSKSGNEAKDSN